MMRYRTTVDISEVALKDVPEIVEKLREHGWPEADFNKMVIHVEYDVGPEGLAVDLWDLRHELEGIEADLGSYMDHPKIPKPEIVALDSRVYAYNTVSGDYRRIDLDDDEIVVEVPDDDRINDVGEYLASVTEPDRGRVVA